MATSSHTCGSSGWYRPRADARDFLLATASPDVRMGSGKRLFAGVYGSLARALAKEVAIATIYGATSLAALVGVVYWVSISA